ncbi:MAG: hypothetical protein JWR22_2929, partial [Herminiimonas sp.]|nr:hypothetical protein [Herminiimonas sp.]
VAKYSIQLSYSRVKRKYITGSICREVFQRIHSSRLLAKRIPLHEMPPTARRHQFRVRLQIG